MVMALLGAAPIQVEARPRTVKPRIAAKQLQRSKISRVLMKLIPRGIRHSKLVRGLQAKIRGLKPDLLVVSDFHLGEGKVGAKRDYSALEDFEHMRPSLRSVLKVGWHLPKALKRAGHLAGQEDHQRQAAPLGRQQGLPGPLPARFPLRRQPMTQGYRVLPIDVASRRVIVANRGQKLHNAAGRRVYSVRRQIGGRTRLPWPMTRSALPSGAGSC